MSSQNVIQSYPPIQSPIVDSRGTVTPVWAKWFNQNYIQTGGSSSTTLGSLINTVAALTLTVDDNNTVLTDAVNSLGVGHYL